jgi:exopolysaccharide biosynthesis polyprenyl glycosylphosphotransferase
VKRPGGVSWAQVVTDALVAVLSVALAYFVRYHVYPTHYIPGGEPPDPPHYVAAAPVLALIVVLTFAFMGVYRHRRGVQFVDEMFSVLGAMAVAAVVGLALIGVYREDERFTYSRLTFAYWVVAASLLILLARYLLRRQQSRWRLRGAGVDKALVVGWGAAADLLVQRIRMFPDYGYRLVGILADEMEAGTEVAGVRVLGRSSELARVVRNRGVDVVFIALTDVSQDRILALVDSCRDCPTDFRIVPSMLEIMTTSVTADQLDGIPLLQLRQGLDIDTSKTVFKRAFDVVVGGLALVLLSPLIGLIALLVKLTSPGPAFVHQERVGLNGRCFRMHKFRSMREDAEATTGPVWAASDDPRRTPVGRVLRRLSLDELPQLWNIVKGEMSLVGPRAERPNFVEEFAARLPRYADRHRVRPGLAGWAQANDLRGQTPVEERLIYDLYYIENWSLAFDLKIILITLFRVWTHKNAY